ncbi:hypothetical protein [Jiangella muralis]|uniref:hypothetical protein n=1 Tax=Jiangella muralis TaxID=702383 RepID=UPI0012F92118|nr:hypothetical protein [Jiangella muralis]
MQADIAWAPQEEPVGRYRSWFNVADHDAQGVLSRTARMNLVPTRFGWPIRNVLVLQLELAQAQAGALDLQETHYDPLAPAPAPVADGWQRVARFGLVPGRNDFRIELPWTAMPLVRFPANFRKRTPASVSDYHDIHVRRLRALGEQFERPVLRTWARTGSSSNGAGRRFRRWRPSTPTARTDAIPPARWTRRLTGHPGTTCLCPGARPARRRDQLTTRTRANTADISTMTTAVATASRSASMRRIGESP